MGSAATVAAAMLGVVWVAEARVAEASVVEVTVVVAAAAVVVAGNRGMVAEHEAQAVGQSAGKMEEWAAMARAAPALVGLVPEG